MGFAFSERENDLRWWVPDDAFSSAPSWSKDRECVNFLNPDKALPNKLGDNCPNVFCRFLEMCTSGVKSVSLSLPPSFSFPLSSSLHLPLLLCVYVSVCVCVAQSNMYIHVYMCTQSKV